MRSSGGVHREARYETAICTYPDVPMASDEGTMTNRLATLDLPNKTYSLELSATKSSPVMCFKYLTR